MFRLIDIDTILRFHKAGKVSLNSFNSPPRPLPMPKVKPRECKPGKTNAWEFTANPKPDKGIW